MSTPKVRFEPGASPTTSSRDKDRDKSKDKDSAAHKSRSGSTSRHRADSKKPEYFFADSEKKSVSKDYIILEKIAAGSFGVVKRARQKETGSLAAIKCVKKANANTREIQNEVNVLRMVQGHPSIVKLHGVYESKNRVSTLPQSLLSAPPLL